MATLAHDIHDKTYGNFDLLTRTKLDFADITVSKWRSRVTGLSIVHLDYNAPIVNGYFVVGTEIFDDTGCPHTLEHLVFMGSNKYPYKGVIDHLANRGFSNGTNAWTDTDNTVYTVSTAGEQGFRQILPVYVDHILYPTLSQAGFLTEVHHINGRGENSGVVYSEMQGRENTPGDLMALKMQQLHFPTGSAYRSETGGLMKALRELTIEQIKSFHSKYYVPHNLTLVVTGKLASGTESLLQLLQDEVELDLKERGHEHGHRPPGWKRPFVETPSAVQPTFAETTRTVVNFPEKDESVGEISISWQGPATNDFLTQKAVDILGIYLTSSATAPLIKEYVEIESPLCTYIYFEEREYATRGSLHIYAGSVPAEHLLTFDERLQRSLQRIVEEGFDMKRMAMVLNRDERQLQSKIESSKGDTFSDAVITDALYGAEDGSLLASSLDDISRYTELRRWSSDDWVKLLKKYYVEPHRIVVVGQPSAVMATRLEEEEKARIAQQKEKMGKDGLDEAERVLEAAKSEHDKEIPTKVLTDFPVPDVKSIAWIPVQSLQEVGVGAGRRRVVEQRDNAELEAYVANDRDPVPFFVQYDQVESNFITVGAHLSLAEIPNDLRPYAYIYATSFFSLPITRASGEHLTHEEVVNKLDDDTVSYDVGVGYSGAFPEIFQVGIKVERQNFEVAVAWLRDLIYGSSFDKERLQVTAAKIQQSLPESKRSGETVLGAVVSDILYDTSSVTRASSLITQVTFIPQLLHRLQDKPDEVIASFERFRKILTRPSGVRFSVAGDILRIQQPRSTWAKHFSGLLTESPLAPARLALETLSPLGKQPEEKAVIVALPTIESSFVSHYTKGLQGFNEPEYPALRVATEVLNATESYLWRYIRGSGLAYGAYVTIDLEAGLVGFSLYRSSDSVEAFKKARSVITGVLDGSIAFEDTTLDAAKSALVYSVAKGLSTPGRAAISSFLNQALKGVPQDHGIKLLEKYQNVTKADVLQVFRKYFLPLFEPSSSIAVAVTAPSRASQIGEELTKIGFTVEHRTLDLGADEGVESGSEESDSEMETDSDDSR